MSASQRKPFPAIHLHIMNNYIVSIAIQCVDLDSLQVGEAVSAALHAVMENV
jgi:hypothetical protein